MKLRHSLILSVVLHLCLFAVVLLLSADLLGRPDISGSTPGGSNKMSDENLFFVKLLVGIDSYREDISKSGKEQPVSKTEKPKLTKSQEIETQNNPTLNILEKTVPFEADLTSENPPTSPFFKGGLNNFPPLVKGPACPVGRGVGGFERGFSGTDNIADIPSKEITTVNVSYGLFSSENRGKFKGNKGKGGLSAGIIEIIKNSIERAKTYPLLAKKRGIEGTVYVSFSISPQGEPRHLKILESSGSRILDNATLDILKKAAPFPYVDVNIEVPVVFRLN